MADDTVVLPEQIDGLQEILEYIFAGLESRTNGNELTGFTLQRVGDGNYRVILRGIGANGPTAGLRVVQFSNGGDGPSALLLAESAYRDNVGRWHIDRFSNGTRKDVPTTDEDGRLILLD